MSRYLSVDTEATGLSDDCHLIQLAFVPVDTETGRVHTEWGKETLIRCPEFDSLRPTLNPWVLKHMKEVIVAAAKDGIAPEDVKHWVSDYLGQNEIKDFFGGEKIVFLGKSLSALDIPILRKTLGEEYFMKTFHHHNVDVTSVSRSFVDAGILPPECVSGTKLIKYLGIRDQVRHTALSDAVDMGEIYLKILAQTKKQLSAALDKP